jgi:hypothetical protein
MAMYKIHIILYHPKPDHNYQAGSEKKLQVITLWRLCNVPPGTTLYNIGDNTIVIQGASPIIGTDDFALP